ncbi:MAG: zinc ABC transporter substrate-binding protein [Clostridia bacterium]|nr:zinc ABC transporter substrate-binding protein [Clostridia bacterium]
MKKILALLLILTMLPLAGCGCSLGQDTGKIKVVATLFPQYDFARHIGGNKVEVTLLLPPGTESHHYDPSPSDMVSIAESRLFIYTGDMMEGWAGDIASSVGDSVTILDASRGITLSAADLSHDHDHALDPHIWLDFDKAAKMCDNIAEELIAASPEDEAYFRANLENYKKKLATLDAEYAATFAQKPSKDLVFGGRFALGYLVDKYSIPHRSAYDSCSANDEPSPQTIAALSDYVRDNDVKVVYCEEFSDPKVAREIAKANNAEVLVLHSAHNLSKDERDKGVTFISIMEQNLENIRKGLE